MGCDVSFLVNGYCEEFVRRSGFECDVIGTREEYLAYLAHPDFSNPSRCVKYALQGMVDVIQPVYEAVIAHCDQHRSIVVANPYMLGARIAREKANFRLWTVNFAPMSIASVIEPPAISARLIPQRWPKMIRPWIGRVIHFVTDRLVATKVNQYRNRLALPSIKDVMRWWQSPDGAFSTFADWFAPACSDWPANHEHVGFVGNVSDQADDVDQDLSQWLDSSDKKQVLFYPSSNLSDLAEFAGECAAACSQLGHRGLMIAATGGSLTGYESSGFRIRRFVPIDKVISKFDVVVHNGGIGIVGQCLRAGVRQIVFPRLNDQFDNAERLRRLGLAITLTAREFDRGGLAAALGTAMADARLGERAADFGRRVIEVDSVGAAARLICDEPAVLANP
jgi:rhamnosyltransferase subunit B